MGKMKSTQTNWIKILMKWLLLGLLNEGTIGAQCIGKVGKV